MTQQTATNNIMSERGAFMWTLNCLYYQARKYFRSMSSGVQNIELKSCSQSIQLAGHDDLYCRDWPTWTCSDIRFSI